MCCNLESSWAPSSLVTHDGSLYLLDSGPEVSTVPWISSCPSLSGPRKAHKHKGIFSGNGVRRFTGGSRPQGHFPRLIPLMVSDRLFRRSVIRGIFLYVPFLCVPFWRLTLGTQTLTINTRVGALSPSQGIHLKSLDRRRAWGGCGSEFRCPLRGALVEGCSHKFIFQFSLCKQGSQECPPWAPRASEGIPISLSSLRVPQFGQKCGIPISVSNPIAAILAQSGGSQAAVLWLEHPRNL